MPREVRAVKEFAARELLAPAVQVVKVTALVFINVLLTPVVSVVVRADKRRAIVAPV